MSKQINIPLPTLKRFSLYLNILNCEKECEWVSTSCLSKKSGIIPITIRKDLGYLGIKGKPQKGFPMKELISSLKSTLGGDDSRDLILVGSWGYGEVIQKYPDLMVGGYKIRVCFDYVSKVNKDSLIPTYPMDRMKDLINRLGVSMALLSVEPDKVNSVSKDLFNLGIDGILNLTLTTIDSEHTNRIVNYSPFNGIHELSSKITKL